MVGLPQLKRGEDLVKVVEVHKFVVAEIADVVFMESPQSSKWSENGRSHYWLNGNHDSTIKRSN